MLPRSCLRLADSKSNSSTRWPRRTTTRVSSGWVASTSILLGIDQSLADRLARGRRCPPRGRRKTARPETGLTVVERMSLVRARDRRIASSRARAGRRNNARRREVALAANGEGFGVRSQHDLWPVTGRQRSASAAAGSFGWRSSTRDSGFKSVSRPAVARGICRTQHGWCPQEHRLRWSVRAASLRRREPNLPATFPPVACRGAVLRRACRMSERGTTGTANRQHPFIRAGGGRWQGSRWRLPAGAPREVSLGYCQGDLHKGIVEVCLTRKTLIWLRFLPRLTKVD